MPDAREIRGIAEKLVVLKLIACANILPSVEAIVYERKYFLS